MLEIFDIVEKKRNSSSRESQCSTLVNDIDVENSHVTAVKSDSNSSLIKQSTTRNSVESDVVSMEGQGYEPDSKLRKAVISKVIKNHLRLISNLVFYLAHSLTWSSHQQQYFHRCYWKGADS